MTILRSFKVIRLRINDATNQVGNFIFCIGGSRFKRCPALRCDMIIRVNRFALLKARIFCWRVFRIIINSFKITKMHVDHTIRAMKIIKY